MDGIAATLHLIALALIGLGAFLLLRALKARRHRLRLQNTPFLTTQELRELTDLPPAAEVSATAEPGPDGPLRAPYSGTPCVWYRIEAVHHHYRSSAGDRLQPDRLLLEESDAAFRLRDGRGTLHCVPAGADIEGAEPHYDRFVPSAAVSGREEVPTRPPAPTATLSAAAPSGLTPGVAYREWAVLPGQTLFVRGAPVRGADGGVHLASTPQTPLTLSARTHRELLRADRGREALGYTVLPAAVALLAGLVLLLEV
ncbi:MULTISPECIES: GIDE domain-containing protein [Nocardiopsis]|uniref:GIDE domain-containing protein n=1 Tax=Nocardiopsis TaxID=2013 RepID=UPI0003490AC8|nr:MULTISPECIES: GIDE domain-containing protein [Nocardiopsis]